MSKIIRFLFCRRGIHKKKRLVREYAQGNGPCIYYQEYKCDYCGKEFHINIGSEPGTHRKWVIYE